MHDASTGTRLLEGIGGAALVIVFAGLLWYLLLRLRRKYGSWGAATNTIQGSSRQTLNFLPIALVVVGIVLIVRAISGH